MKKSDYRRKIYAVTSQPPQEDIELQRLIDSSSLEIPLITAEALFCQISSDKHRLVLFSYRNRHQITPYLTDTSHSASSTETILFGVPYRLHTEKLLQLGNLKGLFYETDSIEKLQAGLKAIIEGKNWLPRDVTSQLLHYYRHMSRNQTLNATIALTSREIQILRSLQTGASNQKIAEMLFISEFTVKSHLYQIFKKIMVKNRAQAMAWANHNLVS